MSNITELLNKIPERFAEKSFLTNRGLSNEVGIHVFCYAPSDEIVVREFFSELKSQSHLSFNIIECDLYKIFLQICEEKRILKTIPSMEEKKGTEFLMNQLQKITSPESFVEKMKYELHEGEDILLITGVGKVYPFMRSHKILDNIQHIFSKIPVVMLYPGEFNGQELNLFGDFHDGNYYRAFNLL